MRDLAELLVQVPAVYAELGHAMLPGRAGGDGPSSSPDPRHRPAPGNLDAAEHRHKLLRGLRWWVDAVVDPDERRFVVALGDSPARMAALLLANINSMADEDRETLRQNLAEWEAEAYPLVGRVGPVTKATLPIEALDAIVPVHVAAQAVGVSVSTVKRRAPGRAGGQVRLRDVAGPTCELSDLPAAWCGQCPDGAHRLRSECASLVTD